MRKSLCAENSYGEKFLVQKSPCAEVSCAEKSYAEKSVQKSLERKGPFHIIIFQLYFFHILQGNFIE